MNQKLKYVLVTAVVLALAMLMAKWSGATLLTGLFDGGDG